MMTGGSKIKDIDTLVKVLESEILELQFACDDTHDGEEIDEVFYAQLEAKKEILEQLLDRLVVDENEA